MLHELVRSLEYTNSSAFQRTLFSAMFLTAFYGLFRIGELSTKSTCFACSVVQYRDLQILLRDGDPCTVKITITDYKHNPDHRPFDILITRDDSVIFARLKAFLSTARCEVLDLALFFVILIRHLLLSINLIPSFSIVSNIAVCEILFKCNEEV